MLVGFLTHALDPLTTCDIIHKYPTSKTGGNMRMSIRTRIALKPLLFLLLLVLFILACGIPAFPTINGASSADDDLDPLILILSAETNTPGGACTPPRENFDFICKYQLDIQLQYSLLEREMIGCTVYRGDENVTSFGQAKEPGLGKHEQTLEVSNFYESMGVYTERVVCSVYETNLQGKILATDEENFEVSLTTTWED